MIEMKGLLCIARLAATRTVPEGAWVRGRLREIGDGFATVTLYGDDTPAPTGELIVVDLGTPAADGWRFFADEQVWQRTWEETRGSNAGVQRSRAA